MRLYIITAFALFLFQCTTPTPPHPPEKLTKSELQLMDTLQMDPLVVEMIRDHTWNTISELKPNLDFAGPDGGGKTAAQLPKGIVFEAGAEEALRLAAALDGKLQSMGYLVFISETNFGRKPDKVGVVKTDDQFDLLRLQGTNGLNYDLTPKAVIEKLQGWEKRFPFKITGCGMDWVQAEFMRPPDDMDAFAKEVYDFCPDVVEQGTATVEALASEMKRANSLYLWWD